MTGDGPFFMPVLWRCMISRMCRFGMHTFDKSGKCKGGKKKKETPQPEKETPRPEKRDPATIRLRGLHHVYFTSLRDYLVMAC